MDRGRKKGRKGKECELCSATARMYCESDEAMLCWECDALVHGANFLVARHTRALLCRTCQSPTPWRASGSRLGPSVSLCHRCSPPSQSPADDLRLGGERGGRSDSESEDDDGDGENGEEDDEGDSEMEDSAAATAEEEEEGENQVVPWSPPPPPPPPTSSSSSEEESSSRAEMGAGSCGGSGSSLKRMRDNADLASHPQDDLPSSSLQLSLFLSAQPPPQFSGRTDTDDDDDDVDDGETTSVGGGGGSNRAGFHLPNDRRRRLEQPTSSTRRSQPTTAGEPCGSSRAAISTIDFVQAT